MATTRTRPAPPDLDAEAEVDLGRYGHALLSRWWLLLLGLVVGAILGYLSTLGGAQTFRAQAVTYMGQPLGSGQSQVQALNTNPSSARTILTSDQVVRRVARRSGMTEGQLRWGTSVTAVQGFNAEAEPDAADRGHRERPGAGQGRTGCGRPRDTCSCPRSRASPRRRSRSSSSRSRRTTQCLKIVNAALASPACRRPTRSFSRAVSRATRRTSRRRHSSRCSPRTWKRRVSSRTPSRRRRPRAATATRPPSAR